MDLLVFLKQTGQIVVGFIRNGIFKENGSRRNDADDIALNESLCLLGSSSCSQMATLYPF